MPLEWGGASTESSIGDMVNQVSYDCCQECGINWSEIRVWYEKDHMYHYWRISIECKGYVATIEVPLEVVMDGERPAIHGAVSVLFRMLVEKLAEETEKKIRSSIVKEKIERSFKKPDDVRLIRFKRRSKHGEDSAKYVEKRGTTGGGFLRVQSGAG